MTHLEVYESIYASLVRYYGEDAAQDAGVKLVTHPPVGDDPAMVRGWLHRVARHAQVDTIRKTHREVVCDLMEISHVVDPRPQIEARLQLRELPRDLAQAIVETLDTPSNGTSTKAVKLHRLRKRLKGRGNG